MAIIRCEICDELKDGDWTEMVEYKDGSACLECMPEDDEPNYDRAGFAKFEERMHKMLSELLHE